MKFSGAGGLFLLTVVMPNHMHVSMRPIGGYELQDVLQAVKS